MAYTRMNTGVEAVFFEDRTAQQGRELREAHRSAKAFRHSVIEDFLPAEVLDRVREEFPSPSSAAV